MAENFKCGLIGMQGSGERSDMDIFATDMDIFLLASDHFSSTLPQ